MILVLNNCFGNTIQSFLKILKGFFKTPCTFQSEERIKDETIRVQYGMQTHPNQNLPSPNNSMGTIMTDNLISPNQSGETYPSTFLLTGIYTHIKSMFTIAIITL